MKNKSSPHHALLAVLLLTFLFFVTSAQALDTVVYYHTDIAGTPLAATDASGNLLWKESYRPYGERLKKQDGGTNAMWFSGKPQDDETGLSYFGARYYDPVIGRFTGMDPNGFVESNIHSFNQYAYGNNNPYKFVDPNGRFAVLVMALFGAAVTVHELVSTPTPVPGHPDAIQSTIGPWDVVGAVAGGARAIAGLAGTGSSTLRMMNPNEIRFSQDSIKSTFSDGRAVSELAEGLKSGAIKAKDVSPLRTIVKDGKMYSLDKKPLNRQALTRLLDRLLKKNYLRLIWIGVFQRRTTARASK